MQKAFPFRRVAVRATFVALAALPAMPAGLCAAERAAERSPPPHYLTLAYGAGSERDFSELVTRPFSPRATSDRIALAALGHEFARVLGGRLAFEGEGVYAYHWPDRPYHEFALALNARWLDFPWNHRLPTTFAVGIGPSYTTRVGPIESGEGPSSQVLNQFNLELTADVLGHDGNAPNVALVARLQHRSGVFGLINGVHGGSDFVTLGFKWRFGG